MTPTFPLTWQITEEEEKISSYTETRKNDSGIHLFSRYLIIIHSHSLVFPSITISLHIETMYSMRGGGYQYPQGTTTFTIHYDNNRTTQNHPSYNERRSTNPVSFSQQHPSAYTGSKTTSIYNSTQTRRVNPALTINPNQPPRSPYPANGKPINTFKRIHVLRLMIHQ